MSVSENEIEKSFDDFSSDLIGKTNLFFKSFKELTKENLENYLDFLGLLDIWNTEDEKQFLWNTFYKFNINGKIVESSVLKGMKEILSKEEMKSSTISFNEKNVDYSRDDNVNLIRLSFDKIRSASIIKSSLDKNLENEQNNLKFDKKMENLNKFVDNCDIKKLKAIRNILILLNYNNFCKHNFLVKISQIKNILDNYSLFVISIDDILKYISFISEKNIKSNENDEEFNINNDAYNLGLKLIENKLKKLENENSINENLEDDLSSNSINNLKDSNIPNKLEQKLKIYLENILNINDDLKTNINILKDLENSMKKCYQNIINNLKNLLSLKDFENRNEDIIKITNNDDDQEELKINIENNISYMNKKYDEVDIFLQEIENNFKLKDKRFKNLNILLDRLIDTKIFLENEINRLLKNKKETEENVNIEFNKADEQINKLFDEKEILNNKIREFIEEIETLKLKNKNIKEKINELENDNEIKAKEIIEKSNQINKLKLEIKNSNNKYDSLLNELIQINNDKEKVLKNHEKQLISNALNNISKKIQLSDKQKNYINYNIEVLLEKLIKLEENDDNNDDKNIGNEEKLIKEKNKRISQLETDLELYREKTLLLSQENKNLKNQIKNNSNINLNTEQSQSYFNLGNLAVSRYSIKIEENNSDKNNNFTIFNKENQILNNNNNNEEKILQPTNSGNLFAPPCFTNTGENEIDNIYNDEIKNSMNSNFIINKNTKFSNENEKIIERYDDKKFINTPGEELNNNNNEEEEIKNNEIINSINNKDRPSNPYRNDINDRKSNSYNENKGNLFDINKSNNEIFKSNDNLNINEELNKNNESVKNSENEINNDKIKQIINNSLNLNIEKFLSLKDMNDILLKNYPNKVNISSYDYLHLFTNPKIKEISNKIGEDYILTDIFSDIIYLLDKYEQLYKNIIFITKKCIYIIEPESYKIKYTFVRTILLRSTLSSINCNIIVFHFMTSNDLVFMTLRRPELISYFIKTEKNVKKGKNEIKFRYADEFNIKKDGDYYTQKIKSSMNSTTFNFQTAIKLGYLIKINEGYLFTKYHEKLVVLTEFGLFYFDNPTVAPKKLVSIIGAEIKDLKNKFGEKLFCFEIVAMNNYKIIFGTYCKEDYEEWLEKLRNTKKQFENKNIFLG